MAWLKHIFKKTNCRAGDLAQWNKCLAWQGRGHEFHLWCQKKPKTRQFMFKFLSLQLSIKVDGLYFEYLLYYVFFYYFFVLLGANPGSLSWAAIPWSYLVFLLQNSIFLSCLGWVQTHSDDRVVLMCTTVSDICTFYISVINCFFSEMCAKPNSLFFHPI